MGENAGETSENAPAQKLSRVLRRVALGLLIALLALAGTLLLLEVFVRLAGEESADGQFVFAGVALQPYALPIQDFAEQVEEYQDNLDRVALIHDERLGWSFRPNSTRQNGDFTINGAGLRSKREYDVQPPADALRVALFGDSFTAADDATDETAWSHLLEVGLNQAGVRTEVLNFGVSAYGMDQAFLRWLHEGRDYEPDIVVFGLQAENLDRNVNVFRQLLHPLGPPFSKPRFIVGDDGLTLVNSPAIPPGELVETFQAFDSHPLAAHEAYYQSRDYVTRWWAGSKLASYAHAIVSQRIEEAQVSHRLDSERGRLGQAIIDAFAADVAQRGKAFLVVFLPHQEYFSRWYYGREIPYRHLLRYLSRTYHYLSFADQLTPEHKDGRHWGATLHYGPELNSALAQLVASEVLDCLQSGVCPLARFDDLSLIYASNADDGGGTG